MKNARRWPLAALLLALALSPARASVEDLFRKDEGAPVAAVAAAPSERPHVFLNTDGLVNASADRKFMEAFAKELESLGVAVTITPYCSKPNNHVLSIKNCPKGAWVVTAASGICAGTYIDMAEGRKGYLKKAWEGNAIRGLIFLNLSPIMLKGLPYLKRAWDDNFSGAGMKGLANPYDYILKSGFFVAESAVANRPELNPARVPVLARQIAAIVGGQAGGASVKTANGKDPGASGADLPALARTGPEVTLPRVRELQKKLAALGLYKRQVDGWFGPFTEAGVRAWQKRQGLPVTGVANAATLRSLGLPASSGAPEGTTAAPPAAGDPALPDEAKRALSPTAKGKANDPAVRALAAKLKGATPRASALSVIAWMRANVRWANYNDTGKSVAKTLSSGVANCCDQASAVVSLLRACGVPARWKHSGDCVFQSGKRSGHVWAEAYVDGAWRAIDTTSGANTLGSLKSFRALAAVKTYLDLPF